MSELFTSRRGQETQQYGMSSIKWLTHKKILVFSVVGILFIALGAAYYMLHIAPRQHLLTYVEELKAKLPVATDDNTQIDKVELDEKNNLHFYYLITENRKFKVEDILPALQNEGQLIACAEPANKIILKVANKIFFHYRTQAQNEIYVFDFDNVKCLLIQKK